MTTPNDLSHHVATPSSTPSHHPFRRPQPRQSPMKVLCLGLSRTGTVSLYLALRQLGYTSYHAIELFRNDANAHPRLWREAIEAKYFGGRGTGRKFDEMLWEYDAVADVPCALFAPELLQAYLDAQVILTERDPEGWVRSIESVFWYILRLRIWKVLEIVDTNVAKHYIPLLRYSLHIWSKGDPFNREALKKGFLEHNQYIKNVVPKEKLLVFHPKDGWEPLCKFLGKPVPEGPFPKVNVGNGVALAHEGIYARERFEVVGKKMLKVVVPVGVAALAMWAYGWRNGMW